VKHVANRTNLIQIRGRAGLSEQQNEFIELVVDGNLSMGEISQRLNISTRTASRWKNQNATIRNSILAMEKEKSLMLLPSANKIAQEILDDPTIGATAKVKIIEMVYKMNGLMLQGADGEINRPAKPLTVEDAIKKFNLPE
jgi:predicted DNA-binding protein YlxM (UPF0122 family)